LNKDKTCNNQAISPSLSVNWLFFRQSFNLNTQLV